MNEQIIEIVLALFWAGFTGLNLWLWKRRPLEQITVEHTGINDKAVNQGEHHATVHH